MAISSVDVAGIEALVSAVLSIHRAEPPGTFLWYRGLTSESHELLPGIMRDKRPSEEVFERERRLLTRFRQRSLAYWPEGYPQDDWEHLFAMQHHGMPTRLLDWTENLFVAAHFALIRPPLEGEVPIIWCFDPVRWNRATPVLSEYGNSIQVLTTNDDEVEAYRPMSIKRRNKSPVALFGTHNSGRIVAQRGTFMVWGEETQPLEAFAEKMDCQIWKIRLTGSPVDLAAELNALGFSETMVFPELGALASELTKVEGWRQPR